MNPDTSENTVAAREAARLGELIHNKLLGDLGDSNHAAV
jgi:hypothetical protein